MLQFITGTVFSGMGIATAAFPAEIIKLSFNKDFLGPQGVTPAVKLLTQCFGAQAALCGILILSAKFTAKTYRNFGLAMIPFFAFDYHFWKNGTLTDFGAAGDAIGNLIFSWCAMMGYGYLKDDENSGCC